MVRETRHLWVGNLPDNIREDRIREHFKRYGRVQSVKLLGRTENTGSGVGGGGSSGICATVAFMDIKSASKAHNAEHVLDERTYTTEYYEPAAIPPSAGAPSAGSSPAGSGYSGSSSSVNSTPAPSSVSRYHISGSEDGTSTTCPLAASAAAPATWRGTNDSATEYCRRGNTPAAYGRTTPHHRWYASTERAAGATGGESTPSTPGGGTESGRRRRVSGSGSSRSESSSPEPSDTSRASTPAQPPPPHHANHRTPPSINHQWASTASGRPLAICVRNLPTRSTDSSLKDGLYHEYKKHGKVMWVKVVGQNADRYAVVRFKKPSDVEKALEVSQDKLFFGCKISVAPHQSCDEDADSAKPYETDIDEYHPKATRTLFIGNLEKDVTQQQLREKFKHFGRIIEIDIKKGSGGGAGYAFCQYASISSVVEAIRAMDGEYVGGSRVKLGFGKPVATTCVWVDGLTEHTEKQVLGAVSRCGAATSVCVDRAAGAALVHFEQAAAAGAAVRELRRVAAALSAAEPDHPRLCVDYASRECQEAFYEQLEKHGGSAALAGSERVIAAGDLTTRYLPSARHDPIRNYEGCGSRSRASSYGRSCSRTPRYSALEHYDPADYAADRRYRVYEELESSPAGSEVPFEERLQSVVVSPHRTHRHRRDSSPDDRKHSKDRHSAHGRSSTRRSRSGSRSGVGHAPRRRHRRRRDARDGSGSRAGTPLRDEPDALPCEPRRPPRERPPLPMSLPLPKFAAQLLRTAPPPPRPQPAPAPDSPPRPPSVSSSSGGSAPHSPSLEERIRSLDEKYEKWSGSRALIDTPDRTRFRHRLLEVDINEVKPSEVVRSLLAKRSVFDEDSERLESAVRAPSPVGSPRARSSCGTPRALRYPYPSHPPHVTHHSQSSTTPHTVVSSNLSNHSPTTLETESDSLDRPADPRLNRPERPVRFEKLGKFNESDYRLESKIRPRTPSTDLSQPDSADHMSPTLLTDHVSESKDSDNSQHCSNIDVDNKSTFNEDKLLSKSHDLEISCKNHELSKNTSEKEFCNDNKNNCVEVIPYDKTNAKTVNEVDRTNMFHTEEKTARDVIDMLLNRIEKFNDCEKKSSYDKIMRAMNDDKKLEVKTVNHDDDLPLTVNDINESLLGYSDKTSPSIDGTQSVLEADKSVQRCHLSAPDDSTHIQESNLKSEVFSEKNVKEKNNHNILDIPHKETFEKENIQFDKILNKEKHFNNKSQIPNNNKKSENEKILDDRVKADRDKTKHSKDRSEKDKYDYGKKSNKTEKHEKDKKAIDDVSFDKYHSTKSDKGKIDSEKSHKDRYERDNDRTKLDEKQIRHDHHKKDKSDKRKDSSEIETSCNRLKKEDKHKHDRHKKEDSKYDSKKESESSKSRKSSRDETSREISRKDSTDSSTSRTSHESNKHKEFENDSKDDIKLKIKQEISTKNESIKDYANRIIEEKTEYEMKIKKDIKEEKLTNEHNNKIKVENTVDNSFKVKPDVIEKQRHYSLDTPTVDLKRKERLNSCSSLPSNIGHKRRMSSQDSMEIMNEDNKKCKNDKHPERRDSKDSRNNERHKTTKFSKGHYAKIIESKTKDDKKNQVKPPDDTYVEYKNNEIKDIKLNCDRLKAFKKSPKEEIERLTTDTPLEGLPNHLDFLATLELRSSEEDEKQKALRREMKEKKRIQQLQQIQELQMQQDALHHAEILNKIKDDKKNKSDEKRKDAAREKRMSTDRKSRDEKNDVCKNRKNRKAIQTSDSSDSDEPKKHSIFDIVDDGPTYISMYDKVKARSCKNMQKQEEEKRQEKIKAKFSQLKQSRAKREEKKRSSWDEDSDSDQDTKKVHVSPMDNSSDEDNSRSNRLTEKSPFCSLEFINKTDVFFNDSNEEDLRNKLTRKNSRTRIMSDSSDDGVSKRSSSKSPTYFHEVKKESISDSDSLQNVKIENTDLKNTCNNKIKKNSLLNLFGKSDSDDCKTKPNANAENDYKTYIKSVTNDISSESETTVLGRTLEIRKKHKKKQKRHKSFYSDDDSKVDNSDIGMSEDFKNKISEKQRRHSNKKERRKDKIRESVDTDDNRDEKIKCKKEKRLSINDSLDFSDNVSVMKKDGKMEDIFGPLSDESDRDGKSSKHKADFSSFKYDQSFSKNVQIMSTLESIESKFKEDSKRRKEKKRKEKRYTKDDDNSLDVDAVSKAIEARLFADSLNDDDSRIKNEILTDHDRNDCSEIIYTDSETAIDSKIQNHKRELKEKEKKKKKKRSKEDRLNRKEYLHTHHQDRYEKNERINCESFVRESSVANSLLNHERPNEIQLLSVVEKSDDPKSLLESPSLPRLTESPPVLIHSQEKSESKENDDCSVKLENPNELDKDRKIDLIDCQNSVSDTKKAVVEVNEISLNITELKSEEKYHVAFTNIVDVSVNAVRSIPHIEQGQDKVAEQSSDKKDLNKVEKKSEEKPRAIISQEETEDAVAALLGESFGGKTDTFSFEESDNVGTHQSDIEITTVENENIPEEDAEEMRQAVQNLNASEMEIKPETPVSDNDLLLIDTDTEEAEETAQDGIERLPINIIATNQSLIPVSEPKSNELSSIVVAKPKSVVATSELVDPTKLSESVTKLPTAKRDNVQIITSTATPVITSWTLSNNKLIEPHVVNIQTSNLAIRDKPENKSAHVTANILQLKTTPQNQNIHINNTIRPVMTSKRVNAPYQVINQMIRPSSNLQPPTIKIPEPHILYHKPQGIVISPRLSTDPRLQSPKVSLQSESITSPRLANMTILNTSPQSLSTVGMASPPVIQQKSPGQVTVVRMQQPPLSPIQAMHIPQGARTMISPSRPNSVLVQAQGTPIHFNRLPGSPILTPISKPMNIVQQNKSGITSPLIHQQKNFVNDCRKNDQRNTENINESSKIILSPTSLQHSSNPTVMAQNRLLSMQNAVHLGNMNTALHLNNKVLLNAPNHLNDKRDSSQKHESQINHIPFVSPPIIHVTGVNHTTASIIHSGAKCNLQETSNMNRGQGSNVIHAINSPRIITSTSLGNVIQIETTKGPPSVLSMSTIRPNTVLTKMDCSAASTLSNYPNIQSPLLVKTINSIAPIRLHNKLDREEPESHHRLLTVQNHLSLDKDFIKNDDSKLLNANEGLGLKIDSVSSVSSSKEHVLKCETDFEELLKDNTNEIKVTNDPEKKLEVNVGKTITLINATSQNTEKPICADPTKKESQELDSNSKKDDKISKECEENFNVKNNSSEESTSIMESVVSESQSEVKPTNECSLKSILKFNQIPVLEKELGTTNTDLDQKDMLVKNTSESEFETLDSQIKSLEENDSWSAKDINIESVIKKVDSYCNDTMDMNDKNDKISFKGSPENVTDINTINQNSENVETTRDDLSKLESDYNFLGDSTLDKNVSVSRRGGRGMRGRKTEKKQERVQTRQISKPSRGTTAKRGRGRTKVDKRIKNYVNNNTNPIPGDVYDFHEDSGDETSTSPSMAEARPRLILTIKSPLSGQCHMTTTSTLSIGQKDQSKLSDKPSKEEKGEDFLSPTQNTRKSRRLQEKDVQKNVDDVVDDVNKCTSVPKNGKEANKKRSTRQAGTKVNSLEKVNVADTRKSPRGVKRNRDRSISDASVDSGDEKVITKREEGVKEPKIAKIEEPTIAPAAEPDPPAPARIAAHVPPTTSVSTPITKPPKKMISEISAKLAGVFEAVVASAPERAPPQHAEREAAREPEPAAAAATGDAVPSVPGAAGDARVQSPALPHRATPVLVRSVAESPPMAAVRRGGDATASLPRGAHHPPDAPHVLHPLHAAKQVAVVGPHLRHHHPGGAARANIPSASPQGQIPIGEGMYPHFSHQHYQMYQQHFRATQHDSRTTPSPYTRSLEAEGCEAPAPPLELRRVTGARVPRPAHSPAPQDRLIMYAAGACGRSPPPAHGSGRGALPPSTAPGPPHASQVPREADSLQMLLRRYPVMWQGLLALKNDSAAVQMHFVGGNPVVAGDTLPRHADGSTPLLRIAQRMRLEPTQLDQVHRKMKMQNEHCMLLALPCGRDHMDVLQQSTNLTGGFITYLQRKQAAGIVNVAPPGHQQAMFTVHIFPSCDFANENLNRIAPDLMHRVADIAHLLIVIATV